MAYLSGKIGILNGDDTLLVQIDLHREPWSEETNDVRFTLKIEQHRLASRRFATEAPHAVKPVIGIVKLSEEELPYPCVLPGKTNRTRTRRPRLGRSGPEFVNLLLNLLLDLLWGLFRSSISMLIRHTLPPYHRVLIRPTCSLVRGTLTRPRLDTDGNRARDIDTLPGSYLLEDLYTESKGQCQVLLHYCFGARASVRWHSASSRSSEGVILVYPARTTAWMRPKVQNNSTSTPGVALMASAQPPLCEVRILQPPNCVRTWPSW